MKLFFTTIAVILSSLTAISQCDPATATHYNMGDFPFTSSSGVTVSMSGTNSGVLGPYGQYGCSSALCEANTIRLDPGDTLIFNFSQPVDEFNFVSGVMNPTENGKILTSSGVPILTSNCPTDLQITGNAFNQVGPLASPVINVSIPGGTNSLSIVCLPASTNGVFTVDVLDCISSCETSSSLTETACDSYTSPSGKTWTATNIYSDTIPNSAGCDSIITIDLTINNSTTGVDSQVSCNSYTWIDGNNYTSSNNSATYTLMNAAGCDSLISLDLTINYPNTGTDVISACDSYTWIDGNTYTSSNNSATYTLTNTAGCDSVVTLDLTINSTPTATIVQNGQSITASPTGGQYQWLDCDNGYSQISGANNITFSPTSAGNYTAEVTLNGCTDTSDCLVFDFIGVDQLEEELFTIYPNPTTGEVTLSFDSPTADVVIFDTQGKSVLETTVENQSIIDFSKFDSGIYLFECTIEGKTTTTRVVKSE